MAITLKRYSVLQHFRHFFNSLTDGEKIHSVIGSVWGWFAGIVLIGAVPVEFILKGIGAIAIAFCSSFASVYGKKAAGWIERRFKGKKKQ